MANDENQKEDDKVSYWQVFMDDIWLLFFLSAAITFISYTVWGLIELGSIAQSPLISQ